MPRSRDCPRGLSALCAAPPRIHQVRHRRWHHVCHRLGIFYTLKLTILEPKPVTAKVIAGIVAVIASYILNREWSFRDRGGRERHHEALLFFAFSGVGVLLSMAPLWVSSYVLRLRAPMV